MEGEGGGDGVLQRTHSLSFARPMAATGSRAAEARNRSIHGPELLGVRLGDPGFVLPLRDARPSCRVQEDVH